MTGDARQLIREGTVTAVFEDEHTARVTFDDKDGLTSAKLPVLTLCSSGNRFYSLPDVGTSVVCLFASNADRTGTGFIIGSRFHDKAKPNANSIDKTRIDFADNSYVEYDRKSHTLKIKCSGKIIIDADGEIKFTGQKNFTLDATENVVVTGKKILLN